MSEPTPQKVTSYQLFTRDLVREEATLPLSLGAVIDQAAIDSLQAFVLAGNAADEAAYAAALAGSRTTVFYQNAPPSDPTSGYYLRVGDVWFNTTRDSDNRMSYRPYRWNGNAWAQVDAPALIAASEIAAGAITADKIAAGQLKTTNYAENANGFPTAGAKLDHTGSALKVAPGSAQLGMFANICCTPSTAFFNDAVGLSAVAYESLTINNVSGYGLRLTYSSPVPNADRVLVLPGASLGRTYSANVWYLYDSQPGYAIVFPLDVTTGAIGRVRPLSTPNLVFSFGLIQLW